MATAKEELEKALRGEGPLGKAAPDEPVFILRAQDSLSDELVDQWAMRAGLLNCPWDKVLKAKNIAQAMREWPKRRTPD